MESEWSSCLIPPTGGRFRLQPAPVIPPSLRALRQSARAQLLTKTFHDRLRDQIGHALPGSLRGRGSV